MTKTKTLTELCQEQAVRPTESVESVPSVDDAIVAARLEKAYAERTPEQIAELTWTERVLLAQGKELPAKGGK